MSQRIDAIFENGVFRPAVPVNLTDGQRVSLDVEPCSADNDLLDVHDLLDLEWIQSCRQTAKNARPLEEIAQILSAFQGSLAERISEERDER
jgi:predicted DNA-binding antitoxin AbrB/MazE fold protein